MTIAKASGVKNQETVEVVVVCESCFRVTTQEYTSPNHAHAAKFVQCSFCGKWVRT